MWGGRYEVTGWVMHDNFTVNPKLLRIRQMSHYLHDIPLVPIQPIAFKMPYIFISMHLHALLHVVYLLIRAPHVPLLTFSLTCFPMKFRYRTLLMPCNRRASPYFSISKDCVRCFPFNVCELIMSAFSSNLLTRFAHLVNTCS